MNKDQGSKFKENLKANKAVYITAIVILAVMIVIASIVAVTNRNKQTETPTPQISHSTSSSTSSSTNTPTEDVLGKLPSFSLPVSGKMFKAHDSEMQVYSETMGDYRVHLGIDILSAEGAPVYAAADGTVTQIWEDVRMGYCVAIQHNGNAVSVYKNLAEQLPEGIIEGAKVKGGQQIAAVGSSAMTEIADEPHLHFEMTVDGLSVDPLEYLSSADIETLTKDTSYEQGAESDK